MTIFEAAKPMTWGGWSLIDALEWLLTNKPELCSRASAAALVKARPMDGRAFRRWKQRRKPAPVTDDRDHGDEA